MIEFHAPAADAPELALSPLHRAAVLTLRHLVEAGPIGLTPNRNPQQADSTAKERFVMVSRADGEMRERTIRSPPAPHYDFRP